MESLTRRRRWRAVASGTYPRVWAASSTRSRAAWATYPWPLSAREAVDRETRAAAAMSRIVGRRAGAAEVGRSATRLLLRYPYTSAERL